jgi:hypothetical protein
MAALREVVQSNSVGVTGLVTAYRDAVRERYRNIVARYPEQKRFLNGWLARADALGDDRLGQDRRLCGRRCRAAASAWLIQDRFHQKGWPMPLSAARCGVPADGKGALDDCLPVIALEVARHNCGMRRTLLMPWMRRRVSPCSTAAAPARSAWWLRAMPSRRARWLKTLLDRAQADAMPPYPAQKAAPAPSRKGPTMPLPYCRCAARWRWPDRVRRWLPAPARPVSPCRLHRPTR